MTYRLRSLPTGGYLLTAPDGRSRPVESLTAAAALVRPALTAAPTPNGERQPFYAAMALLGMETEEDPTWGNRLLQSARPRSDFPLPLWYTEGSAHGCNDVFLVGRFDSAEIVGHVVRATGSYDLTIPKAVEAINALANGLDGVSIDFATPEGGTWECTEVDDEGWCVKGRIVYPVASYDGATHVGIPAFPGARISLEGFPEVEFVEPPPVVDMPEVEDEMLLLVASGDKPAAEGEPCCAPCAAKAASNGMAATAPKPRSAVKVSEPLTAAVNLAKPPAAWFENPGFTPDHPAVVWVDNKTDLNPVPRDYPGAVPLGVPLTANDDGRFYAHLATWGVCHAGVQGECVTVSPGEVSLSRWTTGHVVTAEGTTVAVGALTAGTSHPDDPYLGWEETRRHYDTSGYTVAAVAAGEDELGIWLAGALKPGLTEAQMWELRVCSPSLDCRPIGSKLNLIAALSVPVPGFPTPRYAVTASGAPASLVAAGAPLAEVKAKLAEPWRGEIAALRADLALTRQLLTPLLPDIADKIADKILSPERAP